MGKRHRCHNNQREFVSKKLRCNSRVPLTTDYELVSKHDYVTVDDFVFVRPYVFEFKCHFKPRWRDRTIFDVFVDEFRHAGREYWVSEFQRNRVFVDGQAIDQSVRWYDGCEVVHVVHRHESAVLASPIHIAIDHEGFVVVSKPSSMPVHPCGTYRRNTLQFLLRAFHGYGPLLCVHRLDKETSGLVILAKTPAFAAQFTEEIKQHRFIKTYVAEVVGLFPDSVSECSEPLLWNKRELFASVDKDGLVAKTTFSVVARDTRRNTSIVECQPLTGRTHQIRVHLAHVGYPIVNDWLYGKNHRPYEKNNIDKPSGTNLSSITLHHQKFKMMECQTDEVRPSNKACEWVQTRRKNNRILSSLEEGVELECKNCPQVTNEKNVLTNVMVIHLHALRYKSDNWSFEVLPPPWIYYSDEPPPSKSFCSIL